MSARGRTVLGTATALAVGLALGALVVPSDGADGAGVLDEAASRLVADAVEPVTREQLETAALDAMLAELDDPWATRTPVPAGTTTVGTEGAVGDGGDTEDQGSVGTVGLRLGAGGADGAPVVAGVVPGGSAARAGVVPGTTLEAVDGEDARGVPTTLARLRGLPGSRVTLDLRAAGTPRRLVLLRERRPAVSATTGPDGVVRLRVSSFPQGSGKAVRAAVEQAGRDGARGVALDLRGNGGGLLLEAVETASAFLESGPVLTYERRGQPPRSLDVVAAGDTTTPLVVLVDGGTASAAEVVAAALSDRRGAVLVGSRTVGKGSVQEPSVLSDGTSLRLTVARYLPPSGQVVEGVGLEPDVAVAQDAPPGVAEARAADVLLGLVADAYGGTGAPDGRDGATRSQLPPGGEG